MKSTPVFSADFLTKITEVLTAEQAKLGQELGKMNPSKLSNNGELLSAFPYHGDKEDENAAEVAEYETNLSLEQTLERSARDVDAALERLKQGTYGICKYCKKPINEKRLLARPTSSSCVECKKAILQEA